MLKKKKVRVDSCAPVFRYPKTLNVRFSSLHFIAAGTPLAAAENRVKERLMLFLRSESVPRDGLAFIRTIVDPAVSCLVDYHSLAEATSSLNEADLTELLHRCSSRREEFIEKLEFRRQDNTFNEPETSPDASDTSVVSGGVTKLELASRLLLDTVTTGEGSAMFEAVDFLKKEIAAVEKMTDTMKSPELKEARSQRQRRRRLCAIYRVAHVQLRLLADVGKIKDLLEACGDFNPKVADAQTFHPFLQTSLFVLGGYDKRGNANKEGRKPGKVFGEEMRDILIEANEVAKRDRTGMKALKKINLDIIEKAIVLARKKQPKQKFESEVGNDSDPNLLETDTVDDHWDKHGGIDESKDSALKRMKDGTAYGKKNSVKYKGQTLFFAGNLGKHDYLAIAQSFGIKRLYEKMKKFKGMWELVLPQGWALRSHLKLSPLGVSDAADFPTGGVDICYLMDQDDRKRYDDSGGTDHIVAPIVVGTDVFAKDTYQALMFKEDNELYCLDGGTIDGTLIRATFRQHKNDTGQLPVISIGKNKAIQSVKMPDHTCALLQVHEMIDSTVQAYVNAVAAELLKVKAPVGDRGLIRELFEAALDCLEMRGGLQIVFKSDRDKLKYASIWLQHCNGDGGILDLSLKDCLELGVGDLKDLESVLLVPPKKNQEPPLTLDPSKGPNTKRRKTFDFTVTLEVEYLEEKVSELLRNKDPKDLLARHILPTIYLNAAIHGSRKSAGFKVHQDADLFRGNDIVSKSTKIDLIGDGTLGVFPTAEQLHVHTVVLSPESHHGTLEIIWTRGKQCLKSTVLGSITTGVNIRTSSTFGHERRQHSQYSYVQCDGIFHQTKTLEQKVASKKPKARTSVTMRSIKDITREPHAAFQGMLDNGFLSWNDGKVTVKKELKVLRHYRIKGAATGNRRDVGGEMKANSLENVTVPEGFELSHSEMPDESLMYDMVKLNNNRQRKVWKESYPHQKFLKLKPHQMALFYQSSMPVFKDGETQKLVHCSKENEFRNKDRPSLGELLVKVLEESEPFVNPDVLERFKDSFPRTDCAWTEPRSAEADSLEACYELQMEQGGIMDTGEVYHGIQGLQRTVKSIGPNALIGKLCYHHKFVETCIKNGCTTVALDKDDEPSSFQPIHLDKNGQFMVPGTFDIAHSPFSSTQQTNGIMKLDDPSAQCLVRHYKNFRREVEIHLAFNRKLMSVLQQIHQSEQSVTMESVMKDSSVKKLFTDFLALPPLSGMFSGGAVQIAGMIYKPLMYSTRYLAHISTAEAQNPHSEVNSALCKNVLMKNPVAVYLNPMTFYKGIDTKRANSQKNKIIFLNYYHAESIQAKKRGLQGVVEQSRPSESEDQITDSDGQKTKGPETDEHMKKLRGQINQYSHNNELPFVIEHKHAFSFQTHVNIVLNHLNKTECKIFKVSARDRRPFMVDLHTAQSHVFHRLKQDHISNSKNHSASRVLLAALAGVDDASELGKNDFTKLMRKVADGNEETSKIESLWQTFEEDDKKSKVKTDFMALAALCGKAEPEDLEINDIPESWISTEDTIEIKSEDWNEFSRDTEFTEYSNLITKVMQYQISIKEFIANMINISASQGIRMTREGCTVKALDMPGHRQKFNPTGESSENLRYLTPLFGLFTACLPKILRLRGMPGIRCHDVSTINARNNMNNQYKHRIELNRPKTTEFNLHAIGEKHHLSFNAVSFPIGEDNKPTTASIDSFIDYVSECLFTALVCRITGNANVMDSFTQWKQKENTEGTGASKSTNVPIAKEKSVMEWIHWLCLHHHGYEKKPTKIRTKQYTLNPLLARTVRSLGINVLEIAPAFRTGNGNSDATKEGAIPSLLRSWGTFGEPNRCDLVNTIAKTVSKAVGLQMDNSTLFLAHQTVADIESFLPGIAGEVTPESVHFGHGGKEGCDIVLFKGSDSHLNKNRTSRVMRKKRLVRTHECFADHFLTEASSDELKAMGLMKVNHKDHKEELEEKGATWTHNIWECLSGRKSAKESTRLVFTGSWKSFDLTDVEHFFCKLYLLCIHSGVTRNFSKTPFCGSAFTHPRKPDLNDSDWDNGCIPIGLEKWIAYCALAEPERRYSHHLTDCKANHIPLERMQALQRLLKKEESNTSLHAMSTEDQTADTDSTSLSFTTARVTLEESDDQSQLSEVSEPPLEFNQKMTKLFTNHEFDNTDIVTGEDGEWELFTMDGDAIFETGDDMFGGQDTMY